MSDNEMMSVPTATAKATYIRIAPRKVQIVLDLIRNQPVEKAMAILKYTPKAACEPLEKLLKSAIANWEVKTGKKADSETLYVTNIMVDGGMSLKRLQTAPQGRGYRIRKRFNHVTIFVDTKTNKAE